MFATNPNPGELVSKQMMAMELGLGVSFGDYFMVLGQIFSCKVYLKECDLNSSSKLPANVFYFTLF